jgi:hypothetical protein
MGNWNYVFPLNREAVDWLDEEGFPHPPLVSGNRMPTTREINDAFVSLGETPDHLQIDLDFEHPDHVPNECFKIRGDIVAKLKLLHYLARSCGQLWLYPDTGEIAVIMDYSMDPDAVARTWLEASERDHDWRYFYQHVYAT